MPERTKDGPKARNNQRSLGIRKDLHGGCPNDDNDLSDEEEMEGHRKGKKAKQNDYYRPPRCEISFWLRGEDKQISGHSETKVQWDEVS